MYVYKTNKIVQAIFTFAGDGGLKYRDKYRLKYMLKKGPNTGLNTGYTHFSGSGLCT